MNSGDMIGQAYGRLTVLSIANLGDGKRRVACKCECGKEVIVLVSSLRQGRTRSCGCLRSELVSAKFSKHRESRHRLYKIWLGMKGRCENPNIKSFQNHGAAGVAVCAEWQDYNLFSTWARDHGYDDRLTIERIDPAGIYCPDNCTWIPKSLQARNTRKTTKYTINGQTKSLLIWCEVFQVPLDRAHKRIYSGHDPFTVGEVYQALRRE